MDDSYCKTSVNISCFLLSLMISDRWCHIESLLIHSFYLLVAYSDFRFMTALVESYSRFKILDWAVTNFPWHLFWKAGSWIDWFCLRLRIENAESTPTLSSASSELGPISPLKPRQDVTIDCGKYSWLHGFGEQKIQFMRAVFKINPIQLLGSYFTRIIGDNFTWISSSLSSDTDAGPLK